MTVEFLVRYVDLTPVSTGAADVSDGENVGGAADVTVVPLDATTGRHPTIHGLLHDDHVVGGAFRDERVPFTVLLSRRKV